MKLIESLHIGMLLYLSHGALSSLFIRKFSRLMVSIPVREISELVLDLIPIVAAADYLCPQRQLPFVERTDMKSIPIPHGCYLKKEEHIYLCER